MAFANSRTPGDTSFETHSLTFSILVPDESPPSLINDDTVYNALRRALNDDDMLRAYPAAGAVGGGDPLHQAPGRQ